LKLGLPAAKAAHCQDRKRRILTQTDEFCVEMIARIGTLRHQLMIITYTAVLKY